MKRFALGVLIVLVLSGVAALVMHFRRPIRDVTVVMLHVTIDPHLAKAQMWVGDEPIEGLEVWIDLSGSERGLYELGEHGGIWALEPERVAAMVAPRAKLVPETPGAELFRDVLIAYGDYPVRGFCGIGEVDGEREPWLWLLTHGPDSTRPCGVALRARDGDTPLVARDVILPVERARDPSVYESLLLRRRITERVIEVQFAHSR